MRIRIQYDTNQLAWNAITNTMQSHGCTNITAFDGICNCNAPEFTNHPDRKIIEMQILKNMVDSCHKLEGTESITIFFDKEKS